MALRMRQSLAEIEEEFLDDMQREQTRDEQLRRHAVQRTQKRTRARRQKRSSMRYWLLVISLIATAVGVTAAMFETLYLLLG
jgi:membrane glycosyltransferase